jgi:spore coat protein U-like protein
MNRRSLMRMIACAGAFAAVQLCYSQAGTDMTELSLEALMNVELPPLSSTAVFVVSATAVDSCVVDANALAFGSYDPLTPAATDAVSDITVTCTADVTYNIGLNAGTGVGATVGTRRMTRGEQTLAYSLYRDGARSLVWGDRIGSDSVAGVGTGLPINHKVYGRVPARQAVRSGIYADVIIATVYY